MFSARSTMAQFTALRHKTPLWYGMMSNPFLSVRQVAELLGIRQHGVLSLIRSGEIRAADVSLTPGGRPHWRIMPDDLDGFITRRTHQPAIRQKRWRKLTNAKRYF